MSEGKETINDMKKKAIAMLKMKHERTEDNFTKEDEKEPKKRAIDFELGHNNDTLSENKSEGIRTPNRHLLSPERINVGTTGLSVIEEEVVNKNVEEENIVHSENAQPVMPTILTTNNTQENDAPQANTENVLVNIPHQEVATMSNTNNVQSATQSESKDVEMKDAPQKEVIDNTNKPTQSEIPENNNNNLPKVTPPIITMSQDVQMTDSNKPQTTSPTNNITANTTNVSTNPATQPEVKRISFASAKKEIDDFVAQMEKIEQEMNTKYGINLTEFTYEDLLPDEIKIKLIEDFFNSKEIVDLSKSLNK